MIGHVMIYYVSLSFKLNSYTRLLKKIFIANVASMFFIFGLSNIANADILAITNGGFEAPGYLSGWTPSSDGVVSKGTTGGGDNYATITATTLDGDRLSQNVSWNAGDTLSFDWNFTANDNQFLDGAIFTILNSDNSIYDSIVLAQIDPANPFGSTGWKSTSYTFGDAGSGSLNFIVYNDTAIGGPSQLSIDNVKSPAPEPTSMILLGSGIAGLAGSRLRNKKK
jgi:hypothetical protein